MTNILIPAEKPLACVVLFSPQPWRPERETKRLCRVLLWTLGRRSDGLFYRLWAPVCQEFLSHRRQWSRCSCKGCTLVSTGRWRSAETACLMKMFYCPERFDLLQILLLTDASPYMMTSHPSDRNTEKDLHLCWINKCVWLYSDEYRM